MRPWPLPRPRFVTWLQCTLCKGMSRYFPKPDAQTEALSKDRPQWAKRAKLKPEALVEAPPSGPQPYRRPEDSHMPRRDAKWLRALAAEYTDEAIAGIADLARSCEDPKVRLAAYLALLDRGWGKPQREVVHSGEATVRHVTDPGALHARLARAVDNPKQLTASIEAEIVEEGS